MSATFRALLAEMADALDHNRQCLMDDRSLTHPLADRARAALAEPEPPADGNHIADARKMVEPADEEEVELVACLRREADVYNCHDHTVWLDAADMRRAADLLERLAEPEPVGASDAELLAQAAESLGYERIPLDHEGVVAAAYACELLAFARAVLARWGR